LSDLQDTQWDHHLSVKTLQNVKDLALDFLMYSWDEDEEPVEPVWPTTWSQLTNLTKLDFHCRDSEYNEILPEFLTKLGSLRDLELTLDSGHFNI